MVNSSNHGVGLLPPLSDSPAASIGGVALFAGVVLLFMGFKECSGGSRTGGRGTDLEGVADINRSMSRAMDSGLRKIGLGIVAVLVGAGIAATRLASSPTQDAHAS